MKRGNSGLQFGHLRNLLPVALGEVHFLNGHNIATAKCKTCLVIKGCNLPVSKYVPLFPPN